MEQIPDRIHLRDYTLSADIGAFQSERGHDQRLRFNLTVDLAQPVSEAEDHVDEILSYDVMTDAIASALGDQRYNLLETLAEKIAADVLDHPRAARIEVMVEKLDRVPGALGVSIQRTAGRVEAGRDMVHPSILYLDGDAVPRGATIVMAADQPGSPGAVGAERMIGLLSLDQAAWALSVRLGLDVVATRTELDWAISVGRPVIWAPAAMAADVAGLDATPAKLVVWLAERLNAARIDVAIGAGTQMPPALEQASVPVTRQNG